MAQYMKIEEVSTHGDLRADLGVVRILILQGRYREAESALAGLPDGLPKDVGQAFVHAADGDIPRSDAALQRIISSQEAATSLDDELFMAVQLADVYAFRGKTDEAFRILLERKASLERRRGPADLTVAYLQYELRLSPFLKALHRDPRWAELIKDST
jgi:thioredoxin-like negative regulator of GroEL